MAKKDKSTSLFDIKKTGVTPIPTGAAPIVVGEEEKAIPEKLTGLFDVKKKVQTQPQESIPSTSQLEGSTSDLAGSTSGISGDDQVEPTVSFAPDQLPTEEELKERQKFDLQESLKSVDFSKFSTEDRPPIPELPKVEISQEFLNKRSELERDLFQRVNLDPEILKVLDSEESIKAFEQKILDQTKDEELAGEAEFLLRRIKGKKDLLDSENTENLDVVLGPEFQEATRSIQQANFNLKKDELIRLGFDEEKAEKQARLFNPEEDIISKEEEEGGDLVGVNLGKVREDYFRFLEKQNPDKADDIQRQIFAGTFKGKENELKFLQEALQHQSDIIGIKMDDILSKGAGNATEEEIALVENFESQQDRLNNRFKTLLTDFPEIKERLRKEQVAQQEVDDSYKLAKARALSPGFDGAKAKAEVIYQQVVAPVGGAAVNLVNNVVQFGLTQAKDFVPGEYVPGMAEIVSDWTNSYLDTEKSGSIFKKPSELKGALFKDGELQTEKLVPKVSETLFQMLALIEGGGAVGGGLRALGAGANVSGKLGLVTSSFVQTHNDYFEEAKNLGLSDDEANNFAASSSLMTSVLELINPQQHLLGKVAKKRFTSKVVKELKDGIDLKTAIKTNSKFVAKEIFGENLQEISQEIGDLGVKYLFNKRSEDAPFDVNVTQDDIKELLLLTTIVSGAASAPGIKSKSSLEKSALFNASIDLDKFNKFLNRDELKEDFTEQELQEVSDKVTEYKKVVDGLPKNLDEDSKIKLANLVFNKKKLNEKKSEVHVDEAVQAVAGDDVQTEIDGINDQIGSVFEEQEATAVEKPVAALDFNIEEGGKTVLKIDDKHVIRNEELISRLNDEGFVQKVKDGEINLEIKNPPEDIANALETSELLTKDQLETIKPKEDGEKTKEAEEAVLAEEKGVIKPEIETIKTEEDAVKERIIEEGRVEQREQAPEGGIPTEAGGGDITVEGREVKQEKEIIIPQGKVDQIKDLGFPEDTISKLTEEQADIIIKDDIEFTEDLDIGKITPTIVGKAKIAEGIDELVTAFGGKVGAIVNFNNPSALSALMKIAEGIIEESGFQGEKLINEIKKVLREKFGSDFNEEAIDDVSQQIQESVKAEPEVIVKKKATVKVKERVKVKEGKKQAGFQKRTLEQAEGDSAKEQVKGVVEENRIFYSTMNIQKTVDDAAKSIEKEGGFDVVYDRLISEDVDLDNLAVLQVERQMALDFYGRELDFAVKEGRKKDINKAYNRAQKLQDVMSKDATRAGQASAMLQLWKALRPDGTVELMNRKINKNNDDGRKKKEQGEENTVGETIDNFQKFIESLTKEEIESILSTPKGKDAIKNIVGKNKSNLQNELKSRLKRRKEKVDSVVTRLDSLKISGDKLFALPPGINLAPTIWNGSIEIIKKSIQAGGTMASAIDKAVDFIKKNVKAEFDEKAYRSAFSKEKKSLDLDKDITKEIDKALVDLDLSIKDVIRKHYSEKDELGRKLSEKLIEDAGLSKEDANSISKLIQNELDRKIRGEAEKELSKILGRTLLPRKRNKKSLANELIEQINLGAIDSDFFTGLFAEKFGLAKPLTPEQSLELKRLAEVAQKQESGSLFERKAVIEMLKFMDKLYPKNSVFNTFFSLYYSSLLSGMSTSVLNIVSTGTNIISRPIRDTLNLSKWVRAARKGLKAGKIKDFLAYAPINDMFYMPTSAAQSASLGTKEFAEVWKNGDLDSKFIEQVMDNNVSRVNPLERDRHGKNAFKPFNVKVAGKVISTNPFNYYKFVGRNLSAQDKLMFRMSYDIEITSIIREKQLDEGLRGEALRKAVIDEYTQRNVDFEVVEKKLNKEISEFEKDTGEKVTKGQRAIRLREILESNLDPETRETAESIARSNIFTDKRGGMIAITASWIGRMSNSHPALAVFLKPWVPFTTVVGNVSEYMMDTIPLYGQLRANGLGVTSLIKMASKQDINTSQMGARGSKEYYEQMGRAWLGTTAFLIAASLLIGTDEEDDIYITGGFEPDKFKRGRENVAPKYSIIIKGVEIPYLNIPALAIPLAMIGNYNDRLNMGDPEEELVERIGATAFNSVTTMRELSFVSGVQDFLNMVTDIISGKEAPTQRAAKELYKKYFLTLTKPLPQNFNLVDQIEKLYDPTSFSQKDILDITNYGLGIQRFLNKPSLDGFGEEIKTLPGETLLPYAHWLGLKGEDSRWKFLSKFNSLQSKISGNDEIYFINEEKFELERRKPTPDELFKYTKRAGKIFSENLRSYMSFPGAEERSEVKIETRGEIKTGVQVDIGKLWSRSKKQARIELFNTK